MAVLRLTRLLFVDDVLSGLQSAAQSVVRVASVDERAPNGSPLCTGWFISPGLVVVPGFALPPQEADDARLSVQVLTKGVVTWQAEVIGPPEYGGHGLLPDQTGDAPTVALLRIDGKAPERVLQLSFDAPEHEETVIIVHFAGGDLKAAVGFGKIKEFDAVCLWYDVDTVVGSAGAPVFDDAWRVIGIHVAHDGFRDLNQGIKRVALLDALRSTPSWPEIARHHQIANDAAAQQVLQIGTAPTPSPSDPVVVRAAVRRNMDPTTLSREERARLEPYVADPKATHWTLRPSERRRVIAAVGSLDALREYRDAGEPEEAADRVIQEILGGPPYDILDADDEELAWWIQAVRWFEPVASGLPTPAEVAKVLERRRVRTRLHDIAGSDFRGRSQELKQVRGWYEKPAGPLALTGVGGIGKSALIAQFASELPNETLLLWLDFDRADLAPDDASSVLAAIMEQGRAQIDEFKDPGSDDGEWETSAAKLARVLANAVTAEHPPLLVLDSFEAAQYAERYQELWPVLERIHRELPILRVAVTGRAPVPDLMLAGQPAVAIHLKGLRPRDARAWLRDHKITDESVLDAVIDLADGIPLILRLAVRFIEIGGRMQDLPANLPQTIVAGYLYDRILDRVQNSAFKPLASGVLVLRRLTQDMITPIFGKLLDLPPGEPSAVFKELSRDMALVEGVDVLRVRPELRSATLKLMERDKLSFVQKVDEQAARWYARQPISDPEMAAELVYHRLRVGDVRGAEEAWRDGSGAFLTFAADEIRDAKARGWLLSRLGSAPKEMVHERASEQEADERIRSARSRGRSAVVDKILREQRTRDADSPLVFHEAFDLWDADQSTEAARLLDEAGDAHGRVGRDRTVLRALLAAEANDRRAADRLLARIETVDRWKDRQFGEIDALAVQAARITLTVDHAAEIETLLRGGTRADAPRNLRRIVASVDVVLPRAAQSLHGGTSSLERGFTQVDIEKAREWLLDRVERERANGVFDPIQSVQQRRRTLIHKWMKTGEWIEPPSSGGAAELSREEMAAMELAELGWRRWWLAATQPFLSSASTLCRNPQAPAVPQTWSVFGTLAIFAVQSGGLRLSSGDDTIGDLVSHSGVAKEPLHVRASDWKRMRDTLERGVDPGHDWDRYHATIDDSRIILYVGDLLHARSKELQGTTGGAFLLSIVAPHPLKALVNDLAGRSDSLR